MIMYNLEKKLYLKNDIFHMVYLVRDLRYENVFKIDGLVQYFEILESLF